MAINPWWNCFSYLCHCQCSKIRWIFERFSHKSSTVQGVPAVSEGTVGWANFYLYYGFRVKYFNSYISEASTTCFWPLFLWWVFQFPVFCWLLFSLFWSEDSEYPMKRIKWCNETQHNPLRLNKLLNRLECLKFFFFRDVIYPNEGQLVSKFQRQYAAYWARPWKLIPSMMILVLTGTIYKRYSQAGYHKIKNIKSKILKNHKWTFLRTFY